MTIKASTEEEVWMARVVYWYPYDLPGRGGGPPAPAPGPPKDGGPLGFGGPWEAFFSASFCARSAKRQDIC